MELIVALARLNRVEGQCFGLAFFLSLSFLPPFPSPRLLSLEPGGATLGRKQSGFKRAIALIYPGGEQAPGAWHLIAGASQKFREIKCCGRGGTVGALLIFKSMDGDGQGGN